MAAARSRTVPPARRTASVVRTTASTTSAPIGCPIAAELRASRPPTAAPATPAAWAQPGKAATAASVAARRTTAAQTDVAHRIPRVGRRRWVRVLLRSGPRLLWPAMLRCGRPVLLRLLSARSFLLRRVVLLSCPVLRRPVLPGGYDVLRRGRLLSEMPWQSQRTLLLRPGFALKQ